MNKKTERALLKIVKDADKRTSKIEGLVNKASVALEKVDQEVEAFGAVADAIEELLQVENKKDAVPNSA